MTTKVSRNLRTAVVIPAGGQGTRLGGKVPKQFLRVGDEMILERTVAAFGRHPLVGEIVIACALDYVDRVRRLVERRRLSASTTVVVGGRDRQASVWNALQALKSDARIILIHDAVRPFVTLDLITRVIVAASRHGAAVAAIPARDTLLHERRRSMIDGVIDRSSVWLAQTPQGFRRSLIVDASQSARRSGFRGTDDASLVLRLRHAVKIVHGFDGNIKITSPHDLRIARSLCSSRRADKK